VSEPEPESESESESESEEERPRRSHTAPALIALDRVDEDPTFQLRPEGELSLLATDIARLGQLFPVDLRLKPPDRFQVICGFRRVAALRFLQRDRVLARLHTDLSDEDALLLALASAIHRAPVTKEELAEVRDRLDSEGRLGAAARDMLQKALTPPEETLAPEGVGEEPQAGAAELEAEGEEEEIDADELALDVTRRLGSINQDLSLLADVFAALDEDRKLELIQQLRYASELVTFLEEK
jgi:ParB-like chromosome segregation protein Spo0J